MYWEVFMVNCNILLDDCFISVHGVIDKLLMYCLHLASFRTDHSSFLPTSCQFNKPWPISLTPEVFPMSVSRWSLVKWNLWISAQTDTIRWDQTLDWIQLNSEQIWIMISPSLQHHLNWIRDSPVHHLHLDSRNKADLTICHFCLN